VAFGQRSTRRWEAKAQRQWFEEWQFHVAVRLDRLKQAGHRIDRRATDVVETKRAEAKLRAALARFV
jgi:hypothetical protein